MKTRVIELSVNNRKEVIELPINPPSVEFTEKQLNQAITLLNIGEANLKGERGLKYTKLSSFFPSGEVSIYKNAKKKPGQICSDASGMENHKSSGQGNHKRYENQPRNAD